MPGVDVGMLLIPGGGCPPIIGCPPEGGPGCEFELLVGGGGTLLFVCGISTDVVGGIGC